MSSTRVNCPTRVTRSRKRKLGEVNESTAVTERPTKRKRTDESDKENENDIFQGKDAESYTVKQLKALCRKQKLRVGGKKSVLIARLLNAPKPQTITSATDILSLNSSKPQMTNIEVISPQTTLIPAQTTIIPEAQTTNIEVISPRTTLLSEAPTTLILEPQKTLISEPQTTIIPVTIQQTTNIPAISVLTQKQSKKSLSHSTIKTKDIHIASHHNDHIQHSISEKADDTLQIQRNAKNDKIKPLQKIHNKHDNEFTKAVHGKLKQQDVSDPMLVNNCLKKGIERGHIIIDTEEGLDAILLQSSCLSCSTQHVVKIRDVLYQSDCAGMDHEEGGQKAKVKCDDCCGLYVTGICEGKPRFDSGKYHNHCTKCPGFGKCIGDYRQAHCDTCGKHYFKGLSDFGCDHCKRRELRKCGWDPDDWIIQSVLI